MVLDGVPVFGEREPSRPFEVAIAARSHAADVASSLHPNRTLDRRLLQLINAMPSADPGSGGVLPLPPPQPARLEAVEGEDEPVRSLEELHGEPDAEPAAGPAPIADRAGPAAPSLQPTGEVYTPTSRRDPIEPPLLEPDIWPEWLLSVRLNGDLVSDATLFVENPDDGSFAIDADALRGWRIRVDPADLLTFQGNPFLPLDRLEGARHEIDLSELSMTLDVPPDLFGASEIDLEATLRQMPQAGAGGFFDYDLLYTDGSDIAAVLGGLFEVGGFGSLGHGITNFRVEAMNDDPDFTRLESFLRHDFPERRATLRLGDTLSVGGSFAQGQRFGGIQYGTNFATDPSFVTFPRPAIGGLAQQNSVVDVLIDDATRATRNVPPGPFTIENLPVVTGAGEVQLRVTDLLGREQIVTQPYYVSSRLLREGLHEYSYGFGFERKDFGTKSFDYSDPLANATHRYGVTNRITVEAHLESELDRHSVVLGGSALAADLGVVSAGIGGSVGDGDQGVLGQAAYEYLAGSWNLSLRTRYTSPDFRQFGDDGDVRRIDQANVGFELGDFGRLGLLFINRDRIGEDNDRIFTGSYSVPLGPGNFLLNAVQTVEPENEFALTATYSIPLGPNRSISSSLGRQDGDYGARTQYRRTRGASDLGLDYRLAAEAGDDNTRVDGRFSYQTAYGSGDLELERNDGDNNLRAGVSGSVAMVDGMVSASRRIGQAFGIVSMPGFEDVRVLIDNREAGRTDSNGQLMLPRLRAYEPNRISFDVQDLPLEARVGFNEVMAVPMDRSGVVVDFGIARLYQATGVLFDADGKALPAGLKLTDEAGEIEAWVARDGFTQITGTRTGEAELAGTLGDKTYRCIIAVPEGEDSFAELGDVRCTG